MKKIAENLTFVLLFMLMLFAGCASAKGDSKQDVTTARQAKKVAISYKDQPFGTLSVLNNTGERLVLFAGSVNNNKILGGIEPSGERSFEIENVVPSQSGVFLLRAIKESVYRSKGSNEDDVVFSQMIAFDLSDKNDKTRVIINKQLGGEGMIVFQNDTEYVVEVRVGSTDGEKLMTLKRAERKKILYMNPDSLGYTFFPVYIGYNERDKKMALLSPPGLRDGQLANPAKSIQDAPVIRFSDPGSLTNLTSPVAYIKVQNALPAGVYLRYGPKPLPNQKGNMVLNGGAASSFEIAASVDGTQWRDLTIDRNIGPTGIIHLAPITVKAGYTYNLIVTGDGKYAIDEGKQRDVSKDFQIPFVLE